MNWTAEKNLDNFLFHGDRGYNPGWSPYGTNGRTGIIYLFLQYTRLLGVYEREMQFRSIVEMSVKYVDPRLTWNPNDFNGINAIFIKTDQIWVPDIYPGASASTTFFDSTASQTAKVRTSNYFPTFLHYMSAQVHYNGTIQFTFVSPVTYSCDFELTSFPFDVQQCNYLIGINLFDPSVLALEPYTPVGRNIEVVGSNEWSMQIEKPTLNSNFTTDGLTVGILYYAVVLTRRPQFWIGLVITPTFLIGLLIIIGLFLCDDEDIIDMAVNLGLTAMMSMMVIVGILNDSLAKSDDIPAMGYYILIDIGIICGAVVLLPLVNIGRHRLLKHVLSKGMKEYNRPLKLLLYFLQTKYILRSILLVLFVTLHCSNLGFLFAQAKGLPKTIKFDYTSIPRE